MSSGVHKNVFWTHVGQMDGRYHHVPTGVCRPGTTTKQISHVVALNPKVLGVNFNIIHNHLSRYNTRIYIHKSEYVQNHFPNVLPQFGPICPYLAPIYPVPFLPIYM